MLQTTEYISTVLIIFFFKKRWLSITKYWYSRPRFNIMYQASVNGSVTILNKTKTLNTNNTYTLEILTDFSSNWTLIY